MSEQQPLLQASVAPPEDLEGGPDPEGKEAKHLRWKARTGEFIESKRWHQFVILLIFIDAVCVLVDLTFTLLSKDCTPVEGDEVPAWLDVLSYISLAITSLFVVEIPLNLWSFGLVTYNPFGPVTHAPLHLFDAIIVVVTFILEVVLRGKERELAGLLVLLRLWRLVKLVGGIAVGAGELEEETVKSLVKTKKQLEEALSELAAARAENAELRARMARVQVTDESTGPVRDV